MQIQNIRLFRKKIIQEPSKALKQEFFDENFIGVIYESNDKMGFFNAMHSNKKDIKGFLTGAGGLRISENDQTIYEFLQNAADCNSKNFYLYYDDNYFIAINDGEKFNDSSVKAVLDIAQSTKHDPESIGRFGIGFKLIHTLVGKKDGIDEIIKENRGPIIFSWNKKEDFNNFISEEPLIVSSNYNEELPWLFKILLTSVPTAPNEVLKNLNFEDKILFNNEELNSMKLTLKNCIKVNKIELNTLNKGSIFFLKLGADKFKKLENEYIGFEEGIKNSLNMLKNIESISINGKIIKKTPLKSLILKIKQGSPEYEEIKPEYSEIDGYDIGIKFLYCDYDKRYELLKSPSFYKYLPISDEKLKLSFLIHCDAITILVNRRTIAKDANDKLFETMAKYLVIEFDKLRKEDFKEFIEIYQCLLVSELDNKDEFYYNYFYKHILSYISDTIPIFDGDTKIVNNKENVRIKKTAINCMPKDFGIDNVHWLYWPGNNRYSDITSGAEKILNVMKWDIIDLIVEGEIDKINTTIREKDLSDDIFLEIDKAYRKKRDLREEFYDKFNQISVFSFENYGKLSLNEILKNDSCIIEVSNYSSEIKKIFTKLNIDLCLNDISNYDVIKKILSEKIKFENKFIDLLNIPNNAEKLNIYDKKCIISESAMDIKKIKIFKTKTNKFEKIENLVSAKYNLGEYFHDYQINEEEYEMLLNCIKEIEKKFINKKDMYDKYIYSNWGEIIKKISNKNVERFYHDVFLFIDEDRNLPKNCIFTIDEVFESKENILFIDEFINIKNYNEVANILDKVVSKKLAHRSILKHLKEPSISIELTKVGNILDSNTKEVRLSKNELEILLNFCNDINYRIFNKFIIKEKDGVFILSKNIEKLKSCCSVDKVWDEIIREDLSNKYYIFEESFKSITDLKRLGILGRENFYREIIKENWTSLLMSRNISDIFRFAREFYKECGEKKEKIELNTIPCREGIKNRDEVFINYDALENLGEELLGILTNMSFPKPELKEYMMEPPFILIKDELIDNINISKDYFFSVEETIKIINYCTENKIELFERVIIEKCEKGYNIREKDQNEEMVLVQTLELSKALDEMNCGYYAIDEDLKVKNISKLRPLEEENAVKKLIQRNSQDTSRFLIDYILKASKGIKEKYINEVKSIEISASSNYSSESYEFKLFSLILEFIEEEIIHKIKSKVFVDGERWDSTAYNNNVIFDDGTTLKLKSLLYWEKDKYRNSNNVNISRIFRNLSKVEQIENKIFTKKEMNKEEIYSKIKGIIDRRKLNIEQVIFIIKYQKESNSNTSFNKRYLKEGILMSEYPYKVMENRMILDYLALNKIDIQLKDLQYLFQNFDFQNIIYPSEYAVRKERIPKYIEDWINNNNENIEYLQKLGVLFESEEFNHISIRKYFLDDNKIDSVKVKQQVESYQDSDDIFINLSEWIEEKSEIFVDEDEKEKMRILYKIAQKTRKIVVLKKIENEKYYYGIKTKPKLDSNKIIYFKPEYKKDEDKYFKDVFYKAQEEGYLLVKAGDEIPYSIEVKYDSANLITSSKNINKEFNVDLSKVEIYKVDKPCKIDYYIQPVNLYLKDKIEDFSIKEFHHKKMIFFNNNLEIYDIIPMLKSKGVINSDQIAEIFSKESTKDKEEKEKLKYKIRQLENELAENQVINRNVSKPLGISKEGRQEINIKAQMLSEEYLKEKGWQFLRDDKYTTKIYLDDEGKERSVTVKSAGNGDLFITPREWLNLYEEENSLLLVNTSGGKIRNYSFDDLMQKSDELWLRFNYTKKNEKEMEDDIVSFAKSFIGKDNSNIIMKLPDISSSDKLKPFRRNEKNIGEISIEGDEFLDD